METKPLMWGLRRGQFYIDGLVPQFGLGDEVGEREIAVGACHEVDTVLLEQLFADALGHATKHAEDDAPTSALQRMVIVDAGQDFLLGVVAHGAGVEQHGVGVVKIVDGAVAGHHHHAGHDLTVGHVHLAAVGFYQQALGKLA